jgi:hypothetical protein
LTLDELHEAIPQEYSKDISREQVINYVKHWIDNTILYQEALRLKLDKDDGVKNRLARLKTDLLCAELLSRSAVPLQDVSVPDDMVKKYYLAHKETFIRDKPVVKSLEIVLPDEATAWKVRGLVTPDNFLTLGSQYSKVPVQDPSKAAFYKVDDLPASYAQEIATTRIGGTTQAIKTSTGYSIFRVLDKQPKGSVSDLPEVREDIARNLAATMQNDSLGKILAVLRTKVMVETHFDIIPDQSEPAALDSVIDNPGHTSSDTLTKGSQE